MKTINCNKQNIHNSLIIYLIYLQEIQQYIYNILITFNTYHVPPGEGQLVNVCRTSHPPRAGT